MGVNFQCEEEYYPFYVVKTGDIELIEEYFRKNKLEDLLVPFCGIDQRFGQEKIRFLIEYFREKGFVPDLFTFKYFLYTQEFKVFEMFELTRNFFFLFYFIFYFIFFILFF